VALLLCGLGREPEEDSGGWGRGRREKISEGEGAAAAAWRRDRFRVSISSSFQSFFFFSFFLLSHSLPQNFLICPQSMCFLSTLSQSLDFCSKPSPLSINYINVFKISLICPQCGVRS